MSFARRSPEVGQGSRCKLLPSWTIVAFPKQKGGRWGSFDFFSARNGLLNTGEERVISSPGDSRSPPLNNSCYWCGSSLFSQWQSSTRNSVLAAIRPWIDTSRHARFTTRLAFASSEITRFLFLAQEAAHSQLFLSLFFFNRINYTLALLLSFPARLARADDALLRISYIYIVAVLYRTKKLTNYYHIYTCTYVRAPRVHRYTNIHTYMYTYIYIEA